MIENAGVLHVLRTLAIANLLAVAEAKGGILPARPLDSADSVRLGEVSGSFEHASPPTLPPFPVPPEVRHRRCIDAEFHVAALPRASLVIPYLNETWLQVRATVGSLLAHTPLELIDEILFVDDGNAKEWQYHDGLRALHPKVRVHRNEERQGLIRSKVIGAALVRSPVLVFMEPHCIVGRQWLEPLLARLAGSESHSTLAMPTLDVIPESDFGAYRAAAQRIGGFDWSLSFDWMAPVAARNRSYQPPEPYPTPALSGGIFGIWRDFWESVGAYDVGMSEWGGEHIEMSLRVWRCGGRVEILPCSRVGHVFRARNPYSVEVLSVVRNLKRAALVWLDGHLEDFYREVPAARGLDAGDVEERRQLRAGLRCRSMEWYVQNVYPELLGRQRPGGGDWRRAYVLVMACLSVLPWLPWRPLAAALRHWRGKSWSDSE